MYNLAQQIYKNIGLLFFIVTIGVISCSTVTTGSKHVDVFTKNIIDESIQSRGEKDLVIGNVIMMGTKKDNYEFLLENISSNYLGYDELYDIEAHPREFITSKNKYLIYLVLVSDIEQLSGDDTLHFRINDLIKLEREVFVNYTCQLDTIPYFGIFREKEIIAIYRDDFKNHRFIPEETIRGLKCFEEPFFDEFSIYNIEKPAH